MFYIKVLNYHYISHQDPISKPYISEEITGWWCSVAWATVTDELGTDHAMTDEEEELLADGANWEHSEAAVHTYNLERFFRGQKLLDRAATNPQFLDKNVCIITTMFCIHH